MQRRYGNRHVQRVLNLGREDDADEVATSAVEQTMTRPRAGGPQLGHVARARPESAFGADDTPASVESSVGVDSTQVHIHAGSVVRREPVDRPKAVRARKPTANTGAVIQRNFLDTLGDAADTVSDVASSAADTVSDVAGDAVDAVTDAASDAVDAVSGLIDSAIGTLRSAFDAIVGQIAGVWETVKSGVTNAVEGAIRGASGFLAGIGSFFGAVGTALSSLDVDTLRAAWAAITGAANAALAGVRGIVAQVTATVDSLWSGLKGLADGLIGGLRSQAEGLIDRLPGPAQGPARSLWNTIEEKLTSTWQTIESSWSSLRESALKGVNEVVARVEGVVASIKDSVITTIIGTLDQVKGLFTFIKQVIANPDCSSIRLFRRSPGDCKDCRIRLRARLKPRRGSKRPAVRAPPVLGRQLPRPRRRWPSNASFSAMRRRLDSPVRH